MSNIYTGRLDMELREACVADYRFFRNSLLNFAPGSVDPIGQGLYHELFRDTPVMPWQGKVLGHPCVTVETGVESFAFPDGLDVYLGEDTAFTVEFLSVPQDRGDLAAFLAFMGQATAANPYFGIGQNNRVYIDFGAGQQISDQLEWWRKDAPLHFVLTRPADADPDFQAFCNGTTVIWGGNAVIAAGNNGFTDALGRVYNYVDPQADSYPCYGHHLMMRVYDSVLVQSEVRYLFQQVQRMFAEDLFHIPMWQIPA